LRSQNQNAWHELWHGFPAHETWPGWPCHGRSCRQKPRGTLAQNCRMGNLFAHAAGKEPLVIFFIGLDKG
jgi:hypothetical protein